MPHARPVSMDPACLGGRHRPRQRAPADARPVCLESPARVSARRARSSDNPMTVAKVELGRHLFYDARLSIRQQSASRAQAATIERSRSPMVAPAPVRFDRRDPPAKPGMSLVNDRLRGSPYLGQPDAHAARGPGPRPDVRRSSSRAGAGEARRGSARAAGPRRAPYTRLFADAFPTDAQPVSLDHVVKAIAELRAIDHFRALAIRRISLRPRRRGRSLRLRGRARPCSSASHSRASGVSQRLHVLGSDRFRGRPEHSEHDVEFHNTGLYNLAGSALVCPAAGYRHLRGDAQTGGCG